MSVEKKLQIGNVVLENNIALGPMAGVTDLPFRILCKEQGVGLIYTEMVSAKGIFYNNKNTEELLQIEKRERPVALQLFGSDPQIMSEMAKKIEERNFDILDINMGCPVPKIVNNGEGSALMKNPVLAGQIVEAVAKAIKKPVTVKIRRGFFREECTAPEFAKVLEESGAAAIAVHGRTREQYYSGQADWEVIKQVKENVKIPVIGNGDIFTPMDAKRMMEETGCDGIMIARGARGNPWIFRQTEEYLKSGVISSKPSFDEVIEMIKKHAAILAEVKGEYTSIREMRKHVAWYTIGYPGSAKLRGQMNEVETMEQLIELMENYRDRMG